MKKCKCTIGQRLTGDGCYVCNSEMVKDIIKDNLMDDFLKDRRVDCEITYSDEYSDWLENRLVEYIYKEGLEE